MGWLDDVLGGLLGLNPVVKGISAALPVMGNAVQNGLNIVMAPKTGPTTFPNGYAPTYAPTAGNPLGLPLPPGATAVPGSAGLPPSILNPMQSAIEAMTKAQGGLSNLPNLISGLGRKFGDSQARGQSNWQALRGQQNGAQGPGGTQGPQTQMASGGGAPPPAMSSTMAPSASTFGGGSSGDWYSSPWTNMQAKMAQEPLQRDANMWSQMRQSSGQSMF
jgi:hypothetical protein